MGFLLSALAKSGLFPKFIIQENRRGVNRKRWSFAKETRAEPFEAFALCGQHRGGIGYERLRLSFLPPLPFPLDIPFSRML
jgi:hypothetical protein